MGEQNSAVAHLIANRMLVPGNRVEYPRESLSSGIPALDAFLPYGGYRKGGISELIGHDFKFVMAAAALAAGSRTSLVAYMSTAGVLNPEMMVEFGADMEHCFFLVHQRAGRFLRAVEMVLRSSLFPLVAIHASRFPDGVPLLDPNAYRRLLGLAAKSHCVLLILLDEHPQLSLAARPCALRLGISRVSGWQRGRSRAGSCHAIARPQIPQAPGEIRICIRKCAGHPPGAVLRVEV